MCLRFLRLQTVGGEAQAAHVDAVAVGGEDVRQRAGQLEHQRLLGLLTRLSVAAVHNASRQLPAGLQVQLAEVDAAVQGRTAAGGAVGHPVANQHTAADGPGRLDPSEGNHAPRLRGDK